MGLGARLALATALLVKACSENPAVASDTVSTKLKTSVGYHFTTGDYGTSETTEISYVPWTTRLEIDRWSLQGTIPYLRIDGPADIIVDGPVGPIETTTSGKSDGLGDIPARVSYLLPVEMVCEPRVWLPYVDFVGFVKFPTASRSKGLGTGEFDFGFEFEMTWVVQDFVPFMSVGYRYLGSPPGTPLGSVFIGSLGTVYRVAEPFSVGLVLDYRPAPSPVVDQRLELVPFGTWAFNPTWSLDLYASAGLAQGSPDAGFGVQIAYTLRDLGW